MYRHKGLWTTLIILLTVGLIAATPATDDVDQTVEIVGTDNLRFDVEEIEAAPGETIRIVLRTESNMPPEAMAHNVAIVEPDIDMQSFINASIQAQDNEYIAPEYESQVIANTEMIGGGEVSEITFTAPDEPGEYPYVCTFPGHYSGGMVGTLIVQ